MPIATSNPTAPTQTTPTAPPRQILVGSQYLVHRPSSVPRPASVLETRRNLHGILEVYVSFVGQDKRLDTWVKESDVGELLSNEATNWHPNGNLAVGKPTSEAAQISTPTPVLDLPGPSRLAHAVPSQPSTPDREHATITRVRNFEDVRVGEYLIKTWYYSPYPISADEKDKDKDRDGREGRDGSPLPGSLSSKKRKFANGSSHSGPALERSSTTERVEAGLAMSKTVGGGDLKHGHGRGAPHQPSVVGKMDGTRGRLWVCDLCFKYMRTRAGWDRHTPPGRRVYQKGSYTIWEVDGAHAPLYCQNLSLFGKLFIDHKSVFFHVENFLFYVLCDATTSRHDHVMAFFSKEKLSYDDYNLACIVTFPPHQGKGFGKLLIEFSYYLTLHPSTRNTTLSPGTPERPLSDLGLKGYTAYWTSVVLRFCRGLLVDAARIPDISTNGATASATQDTSTPLKTQSASPNRRSVPEIRTLRERRSSVQKTTAASAPTTNITSKDSRSIIPVATELINGVNITRIPSGHQGQYSVKLALGELAKACHLRVDDTASTLAELGFLQYRRKATPHGLGKKELHNGDGNGPSGHLPLASVTASTGTRTQRRGEWDDVEVVICREAVEREWQKRGVRDRGVLDESCVLL